MNQKIAVVILHYNDANLTINYIDNLRMLNWDGINYHIIVVDNGSPDKSGAFLKDRYANDEDISVLLNDTNLGFSKGNNVGIRYAYQEQNAELIIVSNNDIKIADPCFSQKLWQIYENSQAAVIGPDIYSLGKEIHQSPIRTDPFDKTQLRNKISDIDKKLLILKLVKWTKTYDLISTIKRMCGKKPGLEGLNYTRMQENVVVHGAFFVLSRQYMENYSDGLFDETFLYMEEDILAHRCQMRNLKTLYTPALLVQHFDGYSTSKRMKNRCEKYIFELKETKKSCEIMYNMLCKEKKT